jgi:hypothetical protein
MILSAIREAQEQRRKARNVLRELTIPQAVHYLAADQITRPGKRRAARWAMNQTKKPLCDQHKGKKQRKRFTHILAYREGKRNA